MDKKIFINEGNGLPTLYYDFILLEFIYPVLFTCVDDEENMYLVSCPCADSSMQKWILTKTTPTVVEELLTDKITIRDAFVSSDKKWLIEKTASGTSIHAVRNFTDTDLPTAGYYMEAEDGEFDDEISVMRERQDGFAFTVKSLIYTTIKQVSFEEYLRSIKLEQYADTYKDYDIETSVQTYLSIAIPC